MFIQEVEIFNILGCELVHLSFNDTKRNPVYVVQSDANAKVHNTVTLAVQLLCSAKYSHISDRELNDIGHGAVRIKFILPLSPGRDILNSIGINFDAVGQLCETVANDAGAADSYGAGGDDGSFTMFSGRIGRGRNIPKVGSQTHEVIDNESPEWAMPCSSSALRDRERDHNRNRETNRDRHWDRAFNPQRSKRWQRRSVGSDGSSQKFLIINACRDFRVKPDEVVYSINYGPAERCSVAAFHGRFYICMDYMLPQLENLNPRFRGDWLELLVADVNEKWNRSEQLYDPFERFVRLFLKYGYPEQHLLPQITRTQLMTIESLNIMQKTYAIKILRDTRSIFEFITAGEYAVWFFIPHYGLFADAIIDIMVEDLNFEYMVTYIQNTSQLTKRVWTEAPKAIKDLLLISFQLSLGFHCKQQIIYLQNFKEICQYQTNQLANFAFFQKLGIAKVNWACKNYLQRIIDVCVNSGITAIIEYPGGIPLHPVNAFMIRIYQTQQEDATFLDMKIVNGEQYSFDYFLDCLKDGLKRGFTL